MMKPHNKIKLTLLFLSFITYFNNAITQNNPAKKKKILILSSKGGAGHISAGNTLTSLLEKKYDVVVEFPLETILTPLDFVKSITGKYSCEQIYNRIIQAGWNSFVNFYVKNIAPIQILGRRKKIEKLFADFFKKEKPDLIISIIPLFNLPAKNAADQLNIPYLLIALDMDLTLWTLGFDKINPKNFNMTIYDEILKKGFEKKLKNFSQNQVKPIGMPIRPEFMTKKTEQEKKQIRKEWNIPENKFTILLMMGGAGGNSIINYTKTIIKSGLPVHILVCIGRNTSLEKDLQKLKQKNAKTTFTIIPFTNKVADLMSVSNIFITKPGPGSVNEAKAMHLPIIIDKTQSALFWEKGTIKYVQTKQIGTSITKLRYAKKIIQKYLDKNYYAEQKKSFEKLLQPNFNNDILKLIQEICPISQPHITK